MMLVIDKSDVSLVYHKNKSNHLMGSEGRSARQGPSGQYYLNSRTRIIWTDKMPNPRGKINESPIIDSMIDMMSGVQGPGEIVR
jgi:hypothetical protein